MSKAASLSAHEQALWIAVKRLGEAALRRIEDELGRVGELSGADFGVLSRLEESGEDRLSQQALATAMGWDKSRLSHHLTRMQARKLVGRKPAGRGVEVVLLASGRKALAAARPAHARVIREHLDRLSPAEADALLAIFAKLSA